MSTDLNPECFSKPLNFLWLASEEGKTWREGLDKVIAQTDIGKLAVAQVVAMVQSRLDKIGQQRFRRHYEIKPIALAAEQHLFEIRWQIGLGDQSLHLRLYCSLLSEQSLILGICFRVKRVSDSEAVTRGYQNQDIAEAVSIYQLHAQKTIRAWTK